MATIGIDEVGRGCWAGPLLVVAAKAIGPLPRGLDDSKLLSKSRRLVLFDELSRCCQFGEGWVDAAEIDRLGLTAAMRLGVERALLALGAALDDEIIMDGNRNYCAPQFVQVRCEIGADSRIPIVSAASIHAKVNRDAYMALQAQSYPEYGFDRHVGYGTKTHVEALKRHGATPLHRRSFKPVAMLTGNI